ncbi:MAG: hypothetical protein IIY36_09110, partial [Lachnospiraceae bacterium]|nr:hypothetical protein [Lachnospiraceae bacterium]
MQNWVKKLAKVMAGVLAVVLFAGLFAVLSDVGSVTARADDASFVPSVDKRVESNGDGTYQISLDFTGDADTTQTTANANVLIVYDTSNSMNYYNASGGTSAPHRNDLAEQTLYNFVHGLFTYQNPAGTGTNIQVAFTTFSENSPSQTSDWTPRNQETTWTSTESAVTTWLSSTGTSHKLNYPRGTNWERAMMHAADLLRTADNVDQSAGAVNIVIVYDVSQSMTSRAGSSRYSRADQAEDVVY